MITTNCHTFKQFMVTLFEQTTYSYFLSDMEMLYFYLVWILALMFHTYVMTIKPSFKLDISSHLLLHMLYIIS